MRAHAVEFAASAAIDRPVTMLDLFKRKPDQEDKRPWSQRLTAGLARSREKLAGNGQSLPSIVEQVVKALGKKK